MKNKTVTKQAVIVTLIYLLVSAVYISYSYTIVHTIIHEPESAGNIHRYKGIILILLTSLLVFYIVQRILKKQQRITAMYRESNEYFRTIFENAPTGIAIGNWDGTFDQCNPAFCGMLGYTEDEIKLLNFSDLLHGEDKEVNLYETTLLKSGQKPYFEIESRYIHKNGHPVWNHKFVKLLPGKDESPAKVLALVTDITARKSDEQKLKEQQLLFETMFNAITDGVVITNHKREIMMANRGMKTTFGYSAEELIGNTTEMLYAEPEMYHSAGEMVFGASAKPDGDFYLTYYKNRKNKVFPGETFGTKLYDANGNWIGNLGIMRDISERIAYLEDLKQTNEELLQADLALRTKNVELFVANRKLIKSEAELKRSSRFFEQLYIQSATSTQLLDADGWCVRINPKLSEIFGVKQEDIEGKKYNILQDAEIIRTGVAEILKRVFNHKETVSWEVEFDLKNASTSTGVKVAKPGKRWFQNKAYPLLDNDGNLENVIIQHEDITDRIQMEQKIMSTIIHTEELERKRIAQELHDGIGPLLSAAKLYFQTYATTDNQQLKHDIKGQLVDTLNETINQVSLVSNNLSPHVLNDFGLKAALQRLCDKLKPVSDIVCTFEYKLNRKVKKEFEITLYRVAAELINNTIKHAHANKIEIFLDNDDENIEMIFRNDGKPFDFEIAKRQSNGMGLFNIENRVSSLGGKVEFNYGTKKGIEYRIFLRL